jgi:hypothetical protein
VLAHQEAAVEVELVATHVAGVVVDLQGVEGWDFQLGFDEAPLSVDWRQTGVPRL